jgi:cobalt-zinc-cadmium efflux system outer membrane protein
MDRRQAVRVVPTSSRERRGASQGLAACASAILIALEGCVGPAFAAEPLTLEGAFELALESNPEILAARRELTVARGHMEKARYLNPFNPQIEGGVAERRFDGGGGAVEPSGALSLELEIAGQRAKRIDEAERNLDRAMAEVEDVERRVRAAVGDAFFQGLYQRRRLGLLRQVEDLDRRQRDAATARFESGEVSKMEANLAVVRYAQARKQSLSAERDERNAVAELERLVGRGPAGTTEIAGDLALKPVEVDENLLLETAIAARPDLRAREAELARLDAETALTRSLAVPNPTIRGTYSEDSTEPGTRDRIFGGGIGIPLPIFDRKQADLTALSGLRGKSAHDRDALRLAVETEVREALRAYRAARATVELFEEDALERIRESFTFVETAYRQGKIGLLQLIVAQNDLVAAEFSYIESLRDFWVARVALERAVGQPIEKGATP